jgi:aspartyl-tRNA(Asn)/glutamyl-tRNA(Gln) amidotransferase subunit B
MSAMRIHGRILGRQLCAAKHSISALGTSTAGLQHCRSLQIDSSTNEKRVPFRKQFKDEQRANRATAGSQDSKSVKRGSSANAYANWELTVGIEIHAQLNTDRKLFSRAATSSEASPNSNTALFDLALPGSQPKFEVATLIPAIRAALALNCNLQKRSTFDRKHYFYPDQPAGYQITQYYSPFARDGYITLDKDDGISDSEEGEVRVGIKQIQMEQDTAKTVQQPPDTALLDFNRVGHPLIEIITLPQIHNAKTAAACVRKIQQVLQSVSAVTTGMELGGLRADVNVSVREFGAEQGQHSYHGVGGLGQRTEIKNLSSFKAVEDAIEAERTRQIDVLLNGGAIEGETRGWALGSTTTRRLRGKEGEVDYRYMPDPDLPPIIIGESLIDHLSSTLPMLPDQQAQLLTEQYGLTLKDAKTLIALDDGRRLDYFQDVLTELEKSAMLGKEKKVLGKKAANWTLMELGSVMTSRELDFNPETVPASSLAAIITSLSLEEITRQTAKDLLFQIVDGDARPVPLIISEDNLEIKYLTREEYKTMAEDIISENPEMAEQARKGKKGKQQWFVGQMLRRGQGKVNAKEALKAVNTILDSQQNSSEP